MAPSTHSGHNTFQLGGTGSDTFDLNSIGAAAQYRGFTTFDVVGGAWTVSGGGTGWNVNGGTLPLASGAVLPSTTVERRLGVECGADVSTTTVKAGRHPRLSGGTAMPPA